MAPSVVPPQPTVEDSREDAAAGMQNQDAADDAASGDEAEAQQPKGNGVQTPTGGAPPKKKKKKRTRKIGHTKPSGWEEYCVDGPLPLSVVQEELELYSPKKPFIARIELCIQRYKAKRKWDTLRLQMFTNYLTLGGVSSGQKQFSGGLDPKKIDEMDAEDIAAITATEFINVGQAGGDDDEWDVDFELVARGFLSYKVPHVMGISKEKELMTAVNIVRNFLNYVIAHNVAPEYEANIRAALKICDLAEQELVLCLNLTTRLPGTFNTACSTIYQGHYQNLGDEDMSWMPEEERHRSIFFTREEATSLVETALKKRGTPEQQALGVGRKVVKRHFLSVQVIEVYNPPSEWVQDKDADKTLPENKYYQKTQTLGWIKVKPWVPEDPYVIPEELPLDQLDEITIWLEKTVVQWCFVGMKMATKIHWFEDGLVFMDDVTGLYTSFYLPLENPKEDEGDDDEFA